MSKMILGVAHDWDKRKGLDVFVWLSKHLPNDYQVVLVGVPDDLKEVLDKKIICIKRTHNQKELAEIYSAADVFVNPTREDNFPTVNLEALACGTPVVTFNTGGSPEPLDKSIGAVIDEDDYDGLLNAIVAMCTAEKPVEKCREKAEQFRQSDTYENYLILYDK